MDLNAWKFVWILMSEEFNGFKCMQSIYLSVWTFWWIQMYEDGSEERMGLLCKCKAGRDESTQLWNGMDSNKCKVICI